MKRVPASRYVIFALIAGVGLYWDLFSKQTVFTDLGSPADSSSPVQPVPGTHQLFAFPPNHQGISQAYLEGWLSFRLLTSFNEGALWGIGQRWTALFAVLSILAAGGIIAWLFVCAAAQSLWLTMTLGLIMAGTLGNLWDRLGLHACRRVNGESVFAVRDFLLFTFGDFNWPVFNFADVFLVTGAMMLMLQSSTSRREHAPNADASTTTAATASRASNP